MLPPCKTRQKIIDAKTHIRHFHVELLWYSQRSICAYNFFRWLIFLLVILFWWNHIKIKGFNGSSWIKAVQYMNIWKNVYVLSSHLITGRLFEPFYRELKLLAFLWFHPQNKFILIFRKWICVSRILVVSWKCPENPFRLRWTLFILFDVFI